MNTNPWLKIAQKAVTPKDQAITAQLEAKKKAEIAEKRKKEHEAYLERQARRERKAKELKERDDKRYSLFSKHMFYLHGHGWENVFDEYGSRADDIPFGLFDRVQAAIREQQEQDWLNEQEDNKRMREEEEARKKIQADKKATLTPEEYQAWNKEQSWKMHEEIDKWLDQGFSDYSDYTWIEHRRKKEGKIWIEEQINQGKIRELPNGKFAYYV